MAGEHLDLSSDSSSVDSTSNHLVGRRYVGIHFACCHVYTRVYINCDETAYAGRCPKCHRNVQLRIGPDGSDSRFFTAY